MPYLGVDPQPLRLALENDRIGAIKLRIEPNLIVNDENELIAEEFKNLCLAFAVWSVVTLAKLDC